MELQSETIAVLGLGYIGFPTSLAFVTAGFRVFGVDVNRATVEKLRSGNVHIHENGLDLRYRQVLDCGRFEVDWNIRPSDVFLIAVPTPVNEDKTADLSYVERASESIAEVIRPGNLIILESTVPPRTCLDVIAPIIERRTGLLAGRDYDLTHCPERVIPGRIFEELENNDRVIGGTTRKAAERAAALYSSFVKGKMMLTDTVTAELVKLMENTFRDVNIALANELRAVCEHLGADPVEAITYANRHPRVSIHQPGIGVGGHCIPVDPWFLIESCPHRTPLLQAARRINDSRPSEVVEQILCAAGKESCQSIALLGLAYKPDVDDFRESPAIEVARNVASAFDGQVLVVEPFAEVLPAGVQLGNTSLVSLDHALREADLVVGLVAHSAFKSITPINKVFLDPAGVWN